MVFSGDCSTVRQPRIVEVSSGEGDAYLPSLQPRSFHPQCKDPIFSEHVIFEKLNNLKVTKSPCPDNIHPRILYCNKVPLNYVNSHITLALSRLD